MATFLVPDTRCAIITLLLPTDPASHPSARLATCAWPATSAQHLMTDAEAFRLHQSGLPGAADRRTGAFSQRYRLSGI